MTQLAGFDLTRVISVRISSAGSGYTDFHAALVLHAKIHTASWVHFDIKKTTTTQL